MHHCFSLISAALMGSPMCPRTLNVFLSFFASLCKSRSCHWGSSSWQSREAWPSEGLQLQLRGLLQLDLRWPLQMTSKQVLDLILKPWSGEQRPLGRSTSLLMPGR